MSSLELTRTIPARPCPFCAAVLDPDCGVCAGDRLVVPVSDVQRLLREAVQAAGDETLRGLLEDIDDTRNRPAFH